MINKRGFVWFLVLAFGLTWLIDLAIYLAGGSGMPGVITAIQLSGLMPAAAAILVGLFIDSASPIHRSKPGVRGRCFYYFYLAYTMILAIGVIVILFVSNEETINLVAWIPQIGTFLGLIFLVIIRFTAGRETVNRIGLGWGHWRYWLSFSLGIVAFFALQAALNAFLGLGSDQLASGVLPAGVGIGTSLFINVVQLFLLSFISITLAFGEEFGWRGFLQNELFKLGRVRGVLMLGVIWGIWHWPVILMGHNYPENPILGLLLMVLYCATTGIVYSYAVLKSNSILLASYLHAISNMTIQMIYSLGFTPFDSVNSFGIGIYGIATLAVISLAILRDPIWWKRGGEVDPIAQ